jgi:predicted chitinase
VIRATMSDTARIFISYRRQYDHAAARLLYERLQPVFGAENVFLDVESLVDGVIYRERIREALATVDIVLIVIGPTWLSLTDAEGNRRLEDPEDLLRLEIETALARPETTVVPVLLEDTVLREGELPLSIRSLAGRQARRLRHETYDASVDALIRNLAGDLPDHRRPAMLSREVAQGGVAWMEEFIEKKVEERTTALLDRLLAERLGPLMPPTERVGVAAIPGLKLIGDRLAYIEARGQQALPHLSEAQIARFFRPLARVMVESGKLNPTGAVQLAASVYVECRFQWMQEIVTPAILKSYEGRQYLGNTEQGDGARFIGRGYLMITGRANYTLFSERLGLGDRLVREPELMADPETAAKATLLFFGVRKQGGMTGIDLANAGESERLCRLPSGSLHARALSEFRAFAETLGKAEVFVEPAAL